MLGAARQRGKKQMAKTFLQSEAAQAAVGFVTTAEAQLLAAVERQHAALDLDDPPSQPDPDDRAEEIRTLGIRVIEGTFPEWWVENYTDLDNPAAAAEYADADPDAWSDRKESWAETLRANGMEGSVEELADGAVRSRFGVPLAEFEQLVVEWPEGRQSDEIERIVAAGFSATLEGVERATEEIRDRGAEG